VTHDITAFQGAHRFLSNFWPAPVVYDGSEYPSVEHAYQAAKTLDPAWREKIWTAIQPGAAKRLGKQVPMRADWEQVKVDVMRDLVFQKFAPGTALAAQLLATGDAMLIEGNTWGDRFWGVCGGSGENHLGRLLMEVRAAL
jgi:ribA/ribD-fused uncharacterized protein